MEPVTSRSAVECSTAELYTLAYNKVMKFLFLTLRVDFRYNLSDRKQFYILRFHALFSEFFMKAIEYSLLVSITSPKQEERF